MSGLKPPIKISDADDNVCQPNQDENCFSQYGDSQSYQNPVCRSLETNVFDRITTPDDACHPVGVNLFPNENYLKQNDPPLVTCRPDESHGCIADSQRGLTTSVSLSTTSCGTISEAASCVSTTSIKDNENWENAKHSLVFPFDQHAGPDDRTVIDESESVALDEIASLNSETSAWNPGFAQTDSSHAIVMSTILETSYQEPVVHSDSGFARMIQSKPGFLHYGRSDHGYVPMLRADHGHLFCGEFNHNFRPYGQSDLGNDRMVRAYKSYPSWGQIDHGYMPLLWYDRTYLPFSQLERVYPLFGQSVLTIGRTNHDFLTFRRPDCVSAVFDECSHDVWLDHDYPNVSRSDFDYLTLDWSDRVSPVFGRSDYDFSPMGPIDRGYTSFDRSENGCLPFVTGKSYEGFIDSNVEFNVLRFEFSDHQSGPNNTGGKFECLDATKLGSLPLIYPHGQLANFELDSLAKTEEHGESVAGSTLLDDASSLNVDFGTFHSVEAYEPCFSETDATPSPHFLKPTAQKRTELLTNQSYVMTFLSDATTTVSIFRLDTCNLLRPHFGDNFGLVYIFGRFINSDAQVAYSHHSFVPWLVGDHCNGDLDHLAFGPEGEKPMLGRVCGENVEQRSASASSVLQRHVGLTLPCIVQFLELLHQAVLSLKLGMTSCLCNVALFVYRSEWCPSYRGLHPERHKTRKLA